MHKYGVFWDFGVVLRHIACREDLFDGSYGISIIQPSSAAAGEKTADLG